MRRILKIAIMLGLLVVLGGCQKSTSQYSQGEYPEFAETQKILHKKSQSKAGIQDKKTLQLAEQRKALLQAITENNARK